MCPLAQISMLKCYLSVTERVTVVANRVESWEHFLLLHFKPDALEIAPLLFHPWPDSVFILKHGAFLSTLKRNLDIPLQPRAQTSPGALGLLLVFLPSNSPPWLSLKLITPLKIMNENYASSPLHPRRRADHEMTKPSFQAFPLHKY